MRRTPLALSTLLIPLVIACGDKETTGTDTSSGGDGSDDSASGSDTGNSEAEAVWEAQGIETSATLTGVYASESGVYVVANEGRSWGRAAGSWSTLTIDVDEKDLNGLWGDGTADGLSMVGVGDEGYIATWVGGGWQTEDIGTASFEAVNGPDQDNLMAVGWGGVYMNTAGDWAHQDLGENFNFNACWYNGAFGVAVGQDGDIAINDNGTWTTDQLESRANIYAVSGVARDDIWAVGEAGLIMHWAGSAWEETSVGTTTSFWGVWAASSNKVFVVGANGKAYSYDGTSWTSLPTGVDNVLYAVHGTSGADVWAVGNRGTALHYVE